MADGDYSGVRGLSAELVDRIRRLRSLGMVQTMTDAYRNPPQRSSLAGFIGNLAWPFCGQVFISPFLAMQPGDGFLSLFSSDPTELYAAAYFGDSVFVSVVYVILLRSSIDRHKTSFQYVLRAVLRLYLALFSVRFIHCLLVSMYTSQGSGRMCSPWQPPITALSNWPLLFLRRPDEG